MGVPARYCPTSPLLRPRACTSSARHRPACPSPGPLVPVVSIDEQVQVARVHVVEDVLAVGVHHLHVILHFLLRTERTLFMVLGPGCPQSLQLQVTWL